MPKFKKFKCDILSNFQTMWNIESLKGVSGLYRDIDVKLTYELSDLNVEKNALHTGLECIVR